MTATEDPPSQLSDAQLDGILDMDVEAFRAAAHDVVDRMADYLAGIEDFAVFPSIEPGEVTAALAGMGAWNRPNAVGCENLARWLTDAIANNNRGTISLGGWGGYVTFHFDHSIANINGQLDFFIRGNAIINGDDEFHIVFHYFFSFF